MNKLLCSTGALIIGRNGRNHTLLAKAGQELTCEGYEFMMYQSWYEKWEQVAADIAAMDVSVVTFHVDKGIGELISLNGEGDIELAVERFEINCRMACIMGAKLLVLHLWGGHASDGNISVNIEKYRELKEIADSFGLLLTVEDVPCNRENPLKHMITLHRLYPDISFTFDVRFAAFHGMFEECLSENQAWLWQGPVKHIHIGDFAGEPMDWESLRSCKHPREGKIDFEKFFAHLKKVGYDGTVTVESTAVAEDGSILTDKLNDTFAYLRSLM